MLKQGQHFTQFLGTPKQVASKVSGTGNQTFKATKQQQIDKATYLYGTVNGKSGWISKYYLTTASKPSNPTKPSTNNQLTVTNNSGVAQINAKIVAYILQFMTLKERQQIKSNVHCQ